MESLQCEVINRYPLTYGHLPHKDCPGLIRVGTAGPWEKCSCWHHEEAVLTGLKQVEQTW